VFFISGLGHEGTEGLMQALMVRLEEMRLAAAEAIVLDDDEFE
jgi:hypothetical protein